MKRLLTTKVIYSVIILFALSAFAGTAQATTMLFSNGFESGDFTAGGWTTRDANATVTTAAKDNGTYGAQLWQTTWIQKNVSTVGYGLGTGHVHIKFNRAVSGYGGPDLVYCEWSSDGGSSWSSIGTSGNNGWANKDYSCSIGDVNNPNFAFRFRTNNWLNDTGGNICDFNAEGTVNFMDYAKFANIWTVYGQ